MTRTRTDQLIDLALQEDAVFDDITTRSIIPARHRSRAVIRAKADLVLCGVDVAARVFRRVDQRLQIKALARDGARLRSGGRVLSLRGSTASILAVERTALNFLQRLSGIATLSRRFADRAAGTGVRIVDTRKTTPGWRALEKYAVRTGGCANHRASLGDAILIKDNHIAAAGSIEEAVERVRRKAPRKRPSTLLGAGPIEVEATTLADVRAALRARAGIILLDNMSPAMVRRAVRLIDGTAIIEVSGGIRLDNLRDFLIPGVNMISIGALTHSAVAVDLSLEITGSDGAPGL